MYRFSYAEILDESATLNRERERLALDQAVNLLTLAAKAEPGSCEVLAAVAYLQKLWGLLHHRSRRRQQRAAARAARDARLPRPVGDPGV